MGSRAGRFGSSSPQRGNLGHPKFLAKSGEETPLEPEAENFFILNCNQLFHSSFRHHYLSLAGPPKSLQLAGKMRRFSHLSFINHCPPSPAHPQDKAHLAEPLPTQPFITRDRYPILTKQGPAINEFIFHHLKADGFPQEPRGHQSFINRGCKSI